MGIPDDSKPAGHPQQQQQQEAGPQSSEQAGEEGLELSQLQQLAQEVRQCVLLPCGLLLVPAVGRHYIAVSAKGALPFAL
jgi:hypothetical protein